MQGFFEASSPSLLKEIYNPPTKLFAQGSFPPEEPCIAIVGTRQSSNYGKEMAKWFASSLAKRGYVIVSGLARGIDTIAHEATAAVQGKTIAVLGCGLNIPCTTEQQMLRKNIIANGGAIISEYPADFPPSKITFPHRNRIISGLSIATLIIEAPERSGALITARYALDQGREIFAIPGNIGHKNSVGCNNLMVRGEAYMVTSPEELVATILKQPLPFSISHPTKEEKLPADEKQAFEIIARGILDFDELLVQTHFSVSHLQVILTQLELKELIFRDQGKFAAKLR